MSDASLVNFLQSELLLLSNEIKKKYPEIKESIENIFQLIRKIKDDTDRPNAVEVFSQTELILQPIVLSSRTGNSRVIAIALNCLQKLVIFKAFPRECIGNVFGVLEVAAEMNSDIQLKSLQCLSPLMANFNDLYGSELIRIFAIAFKLQESKVGMVNNATAAIIRQMIISLFERVDEEESRNTVAVSASTSNGFELSHALDALLVLSEVTCRLDDQKCEALDLSKVDKPFALDLIESVLVNHGNVIRSNQLLSSLIKNRICPYLIESLKQPCNSGDFAKTCRHWRIIQFLIVDFNDLFPDECEIFLIFSIKILRASNLTWERAMVLEVLKTIFQSQNLIEEIYLICEKKESKPRIFKDMMEVMIEDVIIKVLNSQPSPTDSQGQIIEALGKSSVLTQFDKSAPPAVSPISLLLLAYEAFNCWFGNMASFLKSTCTERNSLGFNVYKSAKNVHLNPKTVSVTTDLILFIGTPLCRVMERIFVELCYNQIQLHSSTIEFFSRAMTIFSVYEFRSQLRQLMDISLGFGPNLLVFQMILETSQGIGELLEDSLISVTRVIQQIEQLQHQKLRKQHQQPAQNTQNYEDELLLKATELANTFTELTVIWDDKSFTFLIQSYGQLIDELITSGSDERAASSLLLVLSKLKRLSCLNMSRFIESEKCSTSWELLMEDFCKTLQLKDASIRQISCEIVGMIVDLYIKSIPSARMKASKSEVESSSCENYQMRILSPLSKFTIYVPWIDVQKILLDSLMKYLSVFGESLCETSWLLIWKILREDLKFVQQSGEEIESVLALYQKVHDTVKIASGDFLASIPISCFAEFIDLIAEIGKISLPGELNIPLNTVRYLWDISDFLCGSKSLQEVFTLWTGLLKHLSQLSLDSRPELRNSAVQTLLRTVNMNGSSLKGYNEKWSCLFEEILFEFLKDLRNTAKDGKSNRADKDIITAVQIGFAHFSRDSETKQWDETESTVMTGLTTLIMTHFKGILIELPAFPQYWKHYLQILQDYALMQDGSIELTGVAVNCLLQLCTGLKEVERDMIAVYAVNLWQVWIAIGRGSINCETDTESRNEVIKCMFFTQETLLKYFKIFFNLLSLCEIELKWLQVSMTNLTTTLQLPTPSDQVRDVETATEVQKFLVNQILSELLNVTRQHEHNGIVVLIVKEIAKWLKLTTNGPKSRVMIDGISMGYASIRSRQSTASSARSDQDKSVNETNSFVKYTFISMTSILLEKIPPIISSCSISSDGLIPLIEALGKFMKLKYKCPTNNKMPPIWRTSTTIFIAIMKEVCKDSRNSCNKSSELWRTVLNELKGTLHSAKEMFNTALKIESIEADEKFDCQLIELIVEVLIPFNAQESAVFVDEAVDLIFNTARITMFSNESGPNEDFLFPSEVKTLPIAVKEILSFSAYKSIFSLAKEESRVKEKLNCLLKRHLDAYLCDRQIFGNDFPFPRLRDSELYVLMRGMRHLRATEELKQLYELIVKCADFGGSCGCEGVRLIAGECRKILLLLDESSVVELSEDEESDDDLTECTNSVDILNALVTDTAESQILKPVEKPQTPIQQSTSSTCNSQRQTPTISVSSRRSISEELFDHLSHDIRIIQLSQESSQI